MKKAVKIIVWIILILLIIACIIFAMLPSILSSKGAINSILDSLEKKYGGKYHIDEVSLKWYGIQRAGNLKIAQGDMLITAKEASLRMSIFKMLTMRKYPLELIFSGDLEIQNAEIHLGKNTSLTNVNFAANNESRSMTLTGECRTDTTESGSFSAKGTEGQPWNWEGETKHFPSRAVELFYPSFPAFAILGKSFNSKFSYKNSLIALRFSSPKLRFDTNGKLNKSQFMLGKKTVFTYALDAQSSDVIFKDSTIKPISARRIQLTIDPKNANFTYRPFKVNTISADSVKLDLGQMLFRNYGTLSDLLSLIKLQFRPNKDVPLWFQEMPITVDKGLASITRSEILVDNTFEIGLWGDVNFAKQKVNAYLGLPAKLLTSIFKLKTIKPGFTIPVRVDGPFDKITLHKGDALGEIGKIIIAEKAKLPIIPLPVKEAPPARPPYPWSKSR